MKKYFSIIQKIIFVLPFLLSFSYSQNYKVLESDDNHLTLEFYFKDNLLIEDTLIDGVKFTLVKSKQIPLQEAGKPFLPTSYYQIGVPFNSNALITVLDFDRDVFADKFIIAAPDSANQPLDKLNYDQDIYGTNMFYPSELAQINSQNIFRYIKTASLLVAPFQFNPVERTLIHNKRIKIRIDFKKDTYYKGNILPVTDKITDEFIKDELINSKEALSFLGNYQKTLNKTEAGYWYNPNKTYFKIYLQKEGVYRLTYDFLNSAGVPLQNLPIDKIELFNEGIEIPLNIKDQNSNNIFDADDYCEFVGVPPKPSPYSDLNIYNTKNVYWLSIEADISGKRYNVVDGSPNSWSSSFSATPFTLHFEEDKLYERLGHAPDDKRDYWYWGKTSGLNGNLTNLFTSEFDAPKNLSTSSNTFKVRVNMHGMTTETCLNPDHRVKFFLTAQPIGEMTFDGPNLATFETTVDLNQTSIFSTNNLQVAAYGDIPVNPCTPSASRYDEIRVNWYEIEYLRDLKADSNYIAFEGPPDALGKVRFGVFNWLRNNMRILIPGKSSIILNPQITNDAYKMVLFVDDVNESQKYYCSADDYFVLPDSICKDVNSDLRNTAIGTDYIIITYPNFLSAAERLKNFRLNNFPDSSVTNPRVEIVDIFQIYDEFSNGLVNPFAIKDFVSYAFTNWQTPAPSYIVLLGDMSYDYRSLLPTSRPNFIPSIPYHTRTYGQAASDNSFVTVSGDDFKPDLAIGRLSCETIDEANVLVDKIISYPNDNGKKWKQNVLLISSGVDQADENLLAFNESNLSLDRNYLLPNGISSNKIFRYPNPNYPEQLQYKGEGPEIRNGFNEGAVFASYYGHGGGYQWDLVFNNDDIYQLNNGGRLPFISSVTCYTAHFDNQDVFGEQFNKVPGKGSIGFFGSSGLTYWNIGKYFNELLFGQIFNGKKKIIGKAVQIAKNILPEGGYNSDQISLLTLLGDPLLELAIPDKPDFNITSSDIIISPSTPVINDTVVISVKINNYGIVFPNDSLTVQVFISSGDTSYYLNNRKLSSFGETNSTSFKWIPNKDGLYSITVKLNIVNVIPEMDLSDNEVTVYNSVFDLKTPNIVKPLNGAVSSKSTIDFLFADNGYYLNKDLQYLIEIDTSLSFKNPVVKSSNLAPSKGTLNWTSPQLNAGTYFWRTRILTETDSSGWSEIYALRIDANNPKSGYFISEDHLKLFQTSNILYSTADKSLFLNTNLLPPRPANNKFVENIEFTLPSDIISLTAITNDGTYIYFGHMAYYGGLSKIYKLGTGYNGTTKGLLYGSIPNISVPIWHTMFYYNGFLYVATGDAHSLLKVDPNTGDSNRVVIPEGLLNSVDTQVHNGAFYLSTDGRYVYNVAYLNSSGDNKYTVRIIDPEDNWKVVRDLIPTDRSYPNFCGFFVADGYFYPYENYQEGYLRRINLETGFYEEEWFSFLPFQGFYAWTYDSINDVVYSSVFGGNHTPKIAKFLGKYKEAKGDVITNVIGPAVKWNSLEYSIDTIGSTGKYTASLEGFNKNSRQWDKLITQLPAQIIPSIDAQLYKYLRLSFSFVDSSFGQTKPIELKSVHVDFVPPPEIMITKDNISFEPDTILQGYDIILKSGLQNIGSTAADSVKLDYYLRAVDFSAEEKLFKSRLFNIAAGSSVQYTDTIKTEHLLLNNAVKLVASYPKSDMFTFNNLFDNSFYVSRDSSRPKFNITFDGKEIINADIISSQPTVEITLQDDSPLPLSPNMFSITHLFKNVQEVIKIPSENVTYDYSHSKAVVTWKPILEDGRHTLIVSAKDSSNNYFDSTSYNQDFYVYSTADLREVYNYPNPFSDNTYFTFELRGVNPPEEFRIKIFTIAGRLIKEFNIPPSALRIGFNKISWDGRDQDGDEIANGLYFYKVISKQNNEVRTITQKLAKVK